MSVNSQHRISDLKIFRGINRRRSLIVVFMMGIFIVPGCVTVNVNFPESAVQKAADDYVKELYKAKTKTPAPTGHLESESMGRLNFWNLLVPAATAQQVTVQEFQVKSSKATEIQGRQQGRLSKVKKFLAMGVFGEGHDGLLVMKDASAAQGLEADQAKAILKAENEDRGSLYDEVQSANAMAEAQVPVLRKSFARSFQAVAPKGSWIEDGAGNWKRK